MRKPRSPEFNRNLTNDYLSNAASAHPVIVENKDRRRLNARILLAQVGGPRFGELLNIDSSQVSNLIGRNPKRNIGDALARKIEEAFKKETGWLDSDHSFQSLPDVVREFATLYDSVDADLKMYLANWVKDTSHMLQRIHKESCIKGDRIKKR